MGDHRSPHSSDVRSIFGHAFGKTYKFVTKWNSDKSPTKKLENEAEAKFDDKFEAYKKGLNRNEASKPGRYKPGGSIDDNFISRSSGLEKCTSRRSHTPGPRSTYISKSTSRHSQGKRSTSRKSGPLLYESEGSTRRGRKSTESMASATDPSLSRNTSRRSPIIFSQTTFARRKPPPVERKLTCTLEELCEGSVKNIKINREIVSDNGKINQEEEILRVKLKPGWKKGTQITFEGKGDQKPGYLPSDIIFSIEEKRHPLFRRNGDDLEIGVEIPLVQALTGCSLAVPTLLGNEKMNLSFHEEIIYPDCEMVIQGQGMPKPKEEGKRGDLKIRFLVEFPTNLSHAQRCEAYNILQGPLHAWPIRITLSEEEANPIHSTLNLPRTEAERHIVKNMSDEQRKQLHRTRRKIGQLEIEVRDTETSKIYNMCLLLIEKKRLYRISNWGLVVFDRSLVKEEEIGMHWSDGKLYFSVLSKSKKPK